MVVDTRPLRATGWHPLASNRDVVRSVARRHADVVRVGPVTTSRGRLVWSAAAATAAASVVGGTAAAIAGWGWWRRHGRGR